MDAIFQHLELALTALIGVLDWVYVLLTIMCAYTAVRFLGDSNVLKNVTVKMSTRWVVLITAFVLAIIFGLFYWQIGTFPWYIGGVVPYTLSIFFSFLFAVFLNEWGGIEKWLDKLFGVKLTKYKKVKK